MLIICGYFFCRYVYPVKKMCMSGQVCSIQPNPYVNEFYPHIHIHIHRYCEYDNL